jgi:putative hydrolase of the HAD superfamily
MIEDSPENLKTAKELGMGTILVGGLTAPPYVDVHIKRVGEIPEALDYWSASPADLHGTL